MTDRPHIPQSLQIAAVWDDLIRLQPRFKALFPASLARAKARLLQLHPEGGSKRASDYSLFYRIGLVLSREREPLTMGELSEALSVPLSTATRMIDWLVESGYAMRFPDLDDRRIVRVALTETGQELSHTINEFIQQRSEQVLSEFTPQERDELVRLLQKLVKALEKMVG